MRTRFSLLTTLLCLTGATPVFADDSSISVQALLVIAAVQTMILLVIAGFAIWQSHRTYLDTVHLHRMVMEAQQNFVGNFLQSAVLRTEPLVVTPKPVVRPTAPSPIPPERPIATPRREPERERELPPSTRGGAAEFLARNGGEKNPIRGLSDIEIAILDKLVQDPAFFDTHRPEEFGATGHTISSLLSRKLISMDGLKRLNVPDEVRAVLRLWTASR